MSPHFPNLLPLTPILDIARSGGFSVGSFGPRYTSMIAPVLRMAKALCSPVIIQISQLEMDRYGVSAKQFGARFFGDLIRERITVPVVLHLDHTFEVPLIAEAIEADFTSVMIDASAQSFEDNVRITRKVVSLAHKRGVSVEAKLGRICSSDDIETDNVSELFTDPVEAEESVARTNVDALAVSVGTAHGIYQNRLPTIDFDRLQSIDRKTRVHLVLHGGSGVPAELIRQASALPEGRISKVNIATDLEQAVLSALGRKEGMTDDECCQLNPDVLKMVEKDAEAEVADKIHYFLGSSEKANSMLRR